MISKEEEVSKWPRPKPVRCVILSLVGVQVAPVDSQQGRRMNFAWERIRR